MTPPSAAFYGSKWCLKTKSRCHSTGFVVDSIPKPDINWGHNYVIFSSVSRVKTTDPENGGFVRTPFVSCCLGCTPPTVRICIFIWVGGSRGFWRVIRPTHSNSVWKHSSGRLDQSLCASESWKDRNAKSCWRNLEKPSSSGTGTEPFYTLLKCTSCSIVPRTLNEVPRSGDLCHCLGTIKALQLYFNSTRGYRDYKLPGVVFFF